MAGAGNATHGFMDLILMMGIAGPIDASYVDELDLFHTREMYMTWYPGRRRPAMSRYYVNKFLYQVDGDPELLAAYKADPAGAGRALGGRVRPLARRNNRVEQTTWLSFTDAERAALVEHDYVALFELGAHFFLTLTIFIALYDDDYETASGPLSFQREYAAKLSHWLGKDYPTVAL